MNEFTFVFPTLREASICSKCNGYNGLRCREYEIVMEHLECTSFSQGLGWLQMREERTIRARDSE